ncbi:MAG: hypothetical protein F9K19_23780, partial [Rhizobiaceae bacterium]
MTTGGDDETGRRVLEAAIGWIGTPYRHQASRKGVGCDCLGLVRGIWRELYGSEPEAPGHDAARDFYYWSAVLRSVSGFEIYRKVYSNVFQPEK